MNPLKENIIKSLDFTKNIINNKINWNTWDIVRDNVGFDWSSVDVVQDITLDMVRDKLNEPPI
jgi:hypothetical protein